MATLPTQGQPADVATPAMPGDGSSQEADTSQGYTIEIKVDGSGAISVSVEPASEESAEESGSGQTGDGSSGGDSGSEDDEAQSVPNIREAIKLVLDIYKNQGEVQDPSADSDAMAQGYGGGQ